MDKKELLELVQSKISVKIQHLEGLIAETRASNNDTKSSMGDKYETGREMLQQEINNLQIQLNENLRAQQILKSIQPNTHKAVGIGSIVRTDKGLFFISISLGEISVGNSKIFVISPESPLAKEMIGKKEKDVISINKISQQILSVS